MKSLLEKVQEVVEKEVPSNAHVIVKSAFNGFAKVTDIDIMISASNYQVNNVRGQFPQRVFLRLEVETMKLEVLNAGCMGGRSVYLIPDKGNSKECYLAMASVKVPFRKPKKEEKFVLNAIGKFAKNWKLALIENKERLFYSEYVNYEELLKS